MPAAQTLRLLDGLVGEMAAVRVGMGLGVGGRDRVVLGESGERQNHIWA